jgi:hypothetical protein
VRADLAWMSLLKRPCGMAGVTLVEAFHELLYNGGEACVSISRGARNGPHQTTSQYG